MVGNDADAADALQEALIAIAKGIRRFDGRSAFGTWSYRVTTNACLDELRRRRRRPVPDALGTTPADGYGPDPLDRLDGAVAPGGGTTRLDDGGIDAVADRMEIDVALAQLPDDFRVAVVLRDLCDLDYAEIGRVLDIPPGTVRSRIARGRTQLTAMLGNPTASAERPTTSP